MLSPSLGNTMYWYLGWEIREAFTLIEGYEVLLSSLRKSYVNYHSHVHLGGRNAVTFSEECKISPFQWGMWNVTLHWEVRNAVAFIHEGIRNINISCRISYIIMNTVMFIENLEIIHLGLWNAGVVTEECEILCTLVGEYDNYTIMFIEDILRNSFAFIKE